MHLLALSHVLRPQKRTQPQEPSQYQFHSMGAISPVTRPLLRRPKPREEVCRLPTSKSSSNLLKEAEAETKENVGGPCLARWSAEEDITTWRGYLNAYKEGRLSFSNPPRPPPDMPKMDYLPPPIPDNEKERLAAVRSYDISPNVANFQRVVSGLRKTFNTKLAVVSLVYEEKAYVKSEVELGLDGVDREITFCGHTILGSEPLVILDTLSDWRLKGNPLVVGPPYLRFYAGSPIITPEGFAIGTVCILDLKARDNFSVQARHQLSQFARFAMDEIIRMKNQNNSSAIPSSLDDELIFNESVYNDVNGKKYNIQYGRNDKLQEEIADSVLRAPRLSYVKPDKKTSLGRIINHERNISQSSNNPRKHSSPPQTDDVLEQVNTLDIGVALVSRSLKLDLVYIVRLSPSQDVCKCTLLASRGLSTPLPVFDPTLHLRALRSENGLIYENPATSDQVYKIGILVPVWREAKDREECVNGVILAGFAKSGRSGGFTAKEISYLRDFGPLYSSIWSALT